MKTRAEVAKYINQNWTSSNNCFFVPIERKPHAHHFGLVELRAIMDFIYEGEPLDDSEKILP